MKKILSAVIAASMMLICADALAQISVDAGYTGSRLVSKAGSMTNTTVSGGLYAGGSCNIPLFGGVGIAPGLYWKYLDGRTDGAAGSKFREHYITVPVMLGYSFPVSNAFKVFAFAGPGVDFGLSSRSSVTIAGNTVSSDNYGKDSDYGRWDVTIGGGVGVDFLGMIRVRAGYNYGMIDRRSSDNVTMHRSEFHIGAAYIF